MSLAFAWLLLTGLPSASAQQESASEAVGPASTGADHEAPAPGNSVSDAETNSYAGYIPARDSSLTGDGDYSATYPTRKFEIGFEAEYVDDGAYRQPTAIVFLNDALALVPTKLTGQVFEVRYPELTLAIGYEEPQAAWTDCIRLSADCVALADERSEAIAILEKQAGVWTVTARLPAPGIPNDLEWDAETQQLLASGKWSQRLYRWRLLDSATGFAAWSEREQVDLPMCGGQILVLPKHETILVADAFGRDYACLQRQTLELKHHARVYGHNIAGLATNADESLIFFPHQLLNEAARTVVTDITWGGMISNNLRWLRTERMLGETDGAIFKQGRFYPLGSPGNGAGDPSSMAISASGRIAVTLAGTNRVTIGKEGDYYFRQVPVGYRPVACVYTPDQTSLLVVNQFSDSLSLVKLEDFSVQHVPLGPLRSPSQRELGEQLFFNSRLAHDGWMSCHSCHSEGHTNGQLNDNFSDRTFGTPKRVLSLLGQAETAPYAWAGSVDALEQQVENSITSTMAGEQPSREVVLALAEFIRSLPAPPSLMEARKQFAQPPSSELAMEVRKLKKGHAVFKQQGCANCHAGPHFTSPDTYDVGLVDEDRMRLFNPPSLIAVSQRQNALLHDARAKSLRDVVVVEKHQVDEEVSGEDLDALVHYLQSL